MNHILNQPTVLVLNRNWQAIHVKTPAEAFCMMASGAARALDMLGDEAINPVTWTEWLVLPVREQDRSVKTARGPVRVPTVIVAANFTRVPLRRPRLSRRGIWERDGGRCQYTGRRLAPDEGNIDHVVPRSRGGKTSWDNCVLAHREVNSRKADKLPKGGGASPAHPAAPAQSIARYRGDPEPVRGAGLGDVSCIAKGPPPVTMIRAWIAQCPDVSVSECSLNATCCRVE